MGALTIQKVLDSGVKPASQNSSASDTVDLGNGQNTFLVYNNTGGSAAVITITPVLPLSNGTLYPAKSWTVPLTTGVQYIPLRREYDDGTGNNTVTVTATNFGATLQVTAIRTGW